MSVKVAIYQTVHDYPGGAEALAPQMGLKPQTLRNMADPKKTTHGWSLRRFDMLNALADKRSLAEMCQEHGGLFVPMGDFEDAPAARLLKALHRLAKESGDVPRVIELAFKGDGRVNENELKMAEREIAEMVGAGAAVLAVLRQLHEQRRALAEDERP